MANPIKSTGRFATRREWEAEVKALHKRGTTSAIIASLTGNTRYAVDSYIRSLKRAY